MPIQDPLTQQIIGMCYRIANTLGHGFVEKVYENALAFELRRAKITFVQQQSVEVFYEGENVGRYNGSRTSCNLRADPTRRRPCWNRDKRRLMG